MQVYLLEQPAKKRFVAIYKKKEYYFGSPTGYTYVDGADEEIRNNYFKRHMANPTEKYRIDNLIMSPALLSAYILWEDS